MKRKTISLYNAGTISGILILTILQFILHRKIPFMMDDEWYSTNLVTGESLKNFSDIIESQIWHFMNWGGRNITHGILQLTLMTGETVTDILNLLMTLLLTWMICIIAKQKTLFGFLSALTMLIAFNANLKMSMFWQSGTANYVYATVWILLFLWAYIRQTENPDMPSLPWINLWILPIGMMTGWSNENMGPASFVIAIAVIVYLKKVLKRQIPFWMLSGSVTCLLGSCMVILAPGNFVRTAAIPDTTLAESIYNRLLSMLCAGTDFLFPTVLLLTTLLIIYLALLQEKLHPGQWMLLAHAILSYGAMVLSPHYPDRATFGTMCVCIILIVSILADITHKYPKWKTYINLSVGSLWLYAVSALLSEFIFFVPA